MTRYQTLISQAKYADAWALLSPESKASWPYADFEQSWAATAKSWGTAFTLGTPTHDWRSWDPGLPTMYAGDYGRAYLIRVDYPGQVNTNGWDMLLVMPSLSGDWEISIAR